MSRTRTSHTINDYLARLAAREVVIYVVLDTITDADWPEYVGTDKAEALAAFDRMRASFPERERGIIGIVTPIDADTLRKEIAR